MADSIAFVVITGMSGAGKSFAIKCLEDIGFFCVDNLPTTLIPTFADLIARAGQKFSRVALGVDVREGEYLPHLLDAIGELRARGHKVEILFLEASDEALVRRYHETRRRHPLSGEGHVHDAIRAERLQDLLRFLLPAYQREGKAYLTVAIGCTGGRHRSVAFVEELRGFMESQGFTPTVVHRDLDRE